MTELPLAAGQIYDTGPVIELDAGRAHALERELLAMELREARGGLASLELRFQGAAQHERGGIDLAFEHDDTDLLGLGESVRILAGDSADPVELFRGRVSAVEFAIEEDGAPELLVQAEDALFPLRLRRVTRLHPAGSLRGIVEAVLAPSGLLSRIDGLDGQVAAQAQTNESDLAFLRRLLADHDADLQMVGEELHVAPRAAAPRAEVTLAIGFQLQRVRVVADLADQPTGLTFAGFDAKAGRKIAITARDPALGPGRGRTGTEVQTATFGARAEHLDHRHVDTQTEAQALIDAAFAARARGFVKACGTASGNPRIRVGTDLRLQGLGPRFSNTYRVTAACHRFDRSEGYRTEFEAESAFFGG
jgi:uncharacterized protein